MTLRTQSLDLLTRLMRLNKPALLRYLKRALLQQAAQEVMDFLHALLGFCVDPSSGAATAAGATATSSRVHSPLDKQAQGISSLSHEHESVIHVCESVIYTDVCSGCLQACDVLGMFSLDGDVLAM